MKVGFQHIIDQDTYVQYLRRLDARALLAHYGAENATEQPGEDGTTEILHSCLLDRVEPHHTNGDRNPSARCNIDKKLYVCYAGGWSGDLFHLVMKLEGAEAFAETLSTVGELLTGAVTENQTFKDELASYFAGPAVYTLNPPTYDTSILTPWAFAHPYWAQRGITTDAIEALCLGYDPLAKRIVFPHFIGENLVGWQKRVVPGETAPDWPKYKSSPGFPKAESLYAYQLITDPQAPLLVVESPMSVAKAVSLGLTNVVATFGAKVSDHQIELMRKHPKVIVWFDGDQAGLHGEKRLLEGLYRYTETYRVKPEEGRDLADMELSEIVKYTVMHTMPAALRLGELDHARRLRGN